MHASHIVHAATHAGTQHCTTSYIMHALLMSVSPVHLALQPTRCPPANVLAAAVVVVLAGALDLEKAVSHGRRMIVAALG
eukprot:4461923-Pyramimonas_sp.AAC.2